MENEPRLENENAVAEEIKSIDGEEFRKVPTGYTIREFFSRSTPEKGAGPGWDFRWKILEQYGVNEPSELPNEPYYQWQPINKID